jgi:predicted ATPase/class 3 adenylate cyclase/Flp pilus assembly protein TadD
MMVNRALLLTDVVDSTKVAQELGDEVFAQLWARHDRSARDLFRTWRGREIDKTDGFLAMFDSVADAAGFALAYHQAIEAAGLPFKARVGLHWGSVALRQNSDADVNLGAKPIELDGLAKPITARVMALAQGGQTLLTKEARAQLGASELRVQSHGHWRLKGLPEPIELFEVGGDASPFAPPPDELKAYRVVLDRGLWRPAREIKHSVPAERDTFIGRREPLLALARKFDEGSRLVSILGMGGTGKTRLAVRFALTWLGDFPGGVWFCDLSQARTLDGIHFAIAQGLGLQLGTTDPIVQIAQAISGRGQCLVILDNFEQVSHHAEAAIGPLLNRAADARFIVTTRAVLGIAGEDTLALDPLPAEDAETLFVSRAKSAMHGFSPSADDLGAIRQLVQVLDGLPLAIEFAAARVRIMAPRVLVARMTERFKLLGPSTGRRDRQATLRTTFDWSWELLSSAEMTALAQLSVFHRGFTLETAGAVLDLAGADVDAWTPDVIQFLVDKSLVRRLSDQRFDLLESVRDYSSEQLRTEGRFAGSGLQAQSDAITRHFRYFAGLDERAAIADGLAETNNLVAACRRAVEYGNADGAVGALSGAWASLRLVGPFRVALGLVEAARGLPNLSPGQAMAIDGVAGEAHLMLGDLKQALSLVEQGLVRAGLVGDDGRRAKFVCLLGEAKSAEGESHNALQAFHEALALAEAIGDDDLRCRVMNGLGTLCNDLGRLSEARCHFESALRIADNMRDDRWRGGLTGNLAMLMHADGDVEAARSLYERAISLARQIGNRRWEGNTHCNLGLLHLEQGRSKDARDEFELALSMARAMGHVRLECTVLCNLGIAEEKGGDLAQARKRYEESVAMAVGLGDRRSEGQFRGYLGLLLSRLGLMDEALSSLCTGEQVLREADAEASLALLQCQKAELMLSLGRSQECAACLAQAEAFATRASILPESELGRSLARGRMALAMHASRDRHHTQTDPVASLVRPG